MSHGRMQCDEAPCSETAHPTLDTDPDNVGSHLGVAREHAEITNSHISEAA